VVATLESFNPRFGGEAGRTLSLSTKSAMLTKVSIPDLVGRPVEQNQTAETTVQTADVSIPDLVGRPVERLGSLNPSIQRMCFNPRFGGEAGRTLILLLVLFR